MRRCLLVLLLAVLLGGGWSQAVAGPCDDCSFYGQDCCFWSGIDPPWCCGRWYGSAEALVNWQRDNQVGRLGVIQVTDEVTAAPGTAVYSLGNLNFDQQSGFRTTVGRRIDECRAWEATYFGIDDWQAGATIIGPNNLALPGDLGAASLDFFAADQMSITYQSRLQNAEFNWVETHGEYLLFGGFRYLSLREEFNIASTDADSGTSNYNIRTTNDLYGGQYGGRYQQNHGWWGWDITGKIGVYGNDAEQTQFVTDSPAGTLLRDPIAAHAAQIAFVGDVNISTVIHLTNVWSLRAGYNLLWIQGVALAPDQVDFSNVAASGNLIRSEESVFYHGANVGIQAAW